MQRFVAVGSLSNVVLFASHPHRARLAEFIFILDEQDGH
jgi:hypothetical protein